MDFFLINPAGGQLRFPVNPEEVTIEGAKKIETVSIINIGDVDFPVGDERTGISFSSFFPAEYDPSYCRYPDIPDPEQAIGTLAAWRIAGKPVRLLITETQVNTLVLIIQMTHRYVGGEPGDIYFDLSLRYWKEIKVRTADEAQTGIIKVQGRVRPDVRPTPKTYVVKPGDSLWKIAKMLLGNGSRWTEIYNQNKKVIGSNPNLIRPGQKLVIPS